MRTGFFLVCVLTLAFSFGCGGRPSESVTPIKAPELKTILTKVAETGEFEDVKEAISVHIEKLEETDAAKAKELSEDFEKLRKSKNPAQVKEEAKKMAAKL